MRTNIFVLALLFSSTAFAADVAKDFDSLGGNAALLEKAKALNPEVVTSIVQSRNVNLRRRLEIAPEMSGSFGGDTYSRTHSVGINMQYHFNPRWSIGAKYNRCFNQLTTEGQAMVDKAWDNFQKDPRNPNAPIPNMDYPKQEALALLNWYPVYGKLNFLDKAITHFDMYAVLGGGQVTLQSGSTNTYTGGLGVAMWFTPHLSTRLEMRYQRYKAQYDNGPKDLDLAIAGLQLGWLL